MPPRLELPEPRRLLQEDAALRGLRAQDLLDAALADDRVHPSAETDVGKELDEVEPADRRPVHEVLALASAVQAARDRHLRPLERPVARSVVEEELDLAVLRGLARRAAREEHVVGLLGAQLVGRQRARGPDDGIGDVRLPGAVRPDDDGHSRLEPDLDGIGERLEAAQLDRTEVHALGRLAARTDGEARPGQYVSTRSCSKTSSTSRFGRAGSAASPGSKPRALLDIPET